MTSAFQSGVHIHKTTGSYRYSEEIYEYFLWPLIEETWNEHLKPTFEALVAFIRDDIIPWIKENRSSVRDRICKVIAFTVVVDVMKNVLHEY